MIIVVLLPLLVAAEWVEIAQNYRKETHKPTRLNDQTTNKNILYSNHSIVEHRWNQGQVHRINSANVKRIQASERKPTVNIERNPFYHDDFTSTEKPDRKSEIKRIKSGNVIIAGDQQEDTFHEHYDVHQASHVSHTLRNENFERNKHGNVIKLSEIETVTSKTSPDTNERDVIQEQSFENTVKVVQNGIVKDRNVYEYETTPCPDPKNLERKDVKNTDNKQNHTLKHGDKVNIKTKTNAIETLIKFLNVVSQTIKRGTRKSFKSKIRYLEDLRDALLASIEDRIDLAFPDENAGEHRRRRATGTEPRGHVEFPSSESALMTISFLTFAVFLIKLVLQVIHTYKAKTMMVTPAVVATVGRAVFKKSIPN